MSAHLIKPSATTVAVFLLAPLTGLAGSLLWITNKYEAIWPNIMWASFILFIPVCYRLSQMLKPVVPKLTTWAASLNLIGCVGAAGHMNLFRFNAVLPYHGSRYFADVLMQAADKNFIAPFTYLPGLMFPVSYVLLGVAVIKSKALSVLIGTLLIAFGVLFWMGNAGESDIALVACYTAATIAFVLCVKKLKAPRYGGSVKFA